MSGFSYLKALLCVHLGMLVLVVALLVFIISASTKYNFKPAEKKGPIVIACVLGVHVVSMADISLAKKGITSFLKSAGSAVQKMPIGTVMSAGYMAEAGVRVTATKIPTLIQS